MMKKGSERTGAREDAVEAEATLRMEIEASEAIEAFADIVHRPLLAAVESPSPSTRPPAPASCAFSSSSSSSSIPYHPSSAKAAQAFAKRALGRLRLRLEEAHAFLGDRKDGHQAEYRRLMGQYREICNKQRQQDVVSESSALLPSTLATRTKKLSEKNMLKAAEAVTEALQRTAERLASEVERSGTTLSSLDESSKVIDNTMGEGQEYQGELRSATSLLVLLKQRQITDVLLIGAALLLYFAIVLYILKARLYG